MTIPKTARKGLGNIKTNGNRAFRGISLHRAYLKVGSIEMEKERRMVEKHALLGRLEEIDARCRELDETKHRLLVFSGEKKGTLENSNAESFLPKSKPDEGHKLTKFDTKTGVGNEIPKKANTAPLKIERKAESPQIKNSAKKKKRSFSKSPEGLNFKY